LRQSRRTDKISKKMAATRPLGGKGRLKGRWMYAFLLVLGAVIAAAGLALVASGISIQEHTFDLSNVTPGTVAIIGGLILIGLAMVVRALLRVEQALIARPSAMPRPARAGEAVSVVVTPAQAVEAGQVPLPPKPKAVPRPQPAPSAPALSATAEDVRIEAASVVEEAEVSLLPKAPVRSDEENNDVDPAVAVRANGAAHGKGAPAIAVSGRPVRKPQPPQQPQQAKGSLFDSLWPKAQRPAPEVQTMPPVVAAVAPAPAPVLQRAETAEPPAAAQPAALPQVAAAPVSVLKSGVVEGMAYTLYSDGSIEAQLPGGTLRFGSINELRNHIEQNG
jgi:hypothetical protein